MEVAQFLNLPNEVVAHFSILLNELRSQMVIFLKTERANLADIHDPPLTHPPTSTVKPQGVGRSKMDQ